MNQSTDILLERNSATVAGDVIILALRHKPRSLLHRVEWTERFVFILQGNTCVHCELYAHCWPYVILQFDQAVNNKRWLIRRRWFVLRPLGAALYSSLATL